MVTSQNIQLRPLFKQDITAILDIYRELSEHLRQISSDEEATQLILLADQLKQHQQGNMLAINNEDTVVGIAHLYDVDHDLDKAFIRIDLVDPQHSELRCDALILFIRNVFDVGLHCIYYSHFSV